MELASFAAVVERRGFSLGLLLFQFAGFRGSSKTCASMLGFVADIAANSRFFISASLIILIFAHIGLGSN